MMNKLLQLVEKPHLKKEPPQFEVGDTVDVSTRIIEGEKERIQVFTGVVIMKKGAGDQRDIHGQANREQRRRRENFPAAFAVRFPRDRKAQRRIAPRKALLSSRSCRQGHAAYREAQGKKEESPATTEKPELAASGA